MSQQRCHKTDFAAILLSAVTVFFGLALITFDPADSPSKLVYPANADTGNLCGRAGAWLALRAFQALGVGAYYWVISQGALCVYLLRNNTLGEPALRALGWTLSLLGVTALAAMAAPHWSPGTVISSGGYLGAGLRGYLELHCASIGAYILVASLILGGLLLSTDYLLFRAAGAVTTKSTRIGASAVRKLPALIPSKRISAQLTTNGKRTDLGTIELDKPAETAAAEGDEDDDGEYQVPIKRLSGDAEKAKASDETADEGEAEASEAGDGETAETDSVRVRPPRKNERAAVLAELDAASEAQAAADYELPPLDLLLDGEPFSFDEQEKDVRRKAKILEKTFANFGFKVKVVEVETGPVIAQFEVELEAGLRLSKITSLSEDLAIALRVPSVRIVAPIPGKNTVGIEVPNAERQLVRLREVIEESSSKVSKMKIPIYLGKDVSGKPMVVDLTSLPHLLIAGRTGTGKSVCLNTIIMSILMARRPDDVRMLLIDPKMVELSSYMKLPHLMHPVVTDMKKAEAILAWAVDKMEERYALLARAGVRHISVYNQLGEEEIFERLQPENDEERKAIPTHLPYIIIVADEMADLMMTAAKEVEAHIIRLAQKSRAVGIHLVLATQKPTVDVITGLIKSNLPARISFQVASRTDSRVVLDEMGADKLLGNGDLLFLWPGTSMLLRGQGAFVSDDEITRVVDFVGTTEPQFVHELVALKPASSDGEPGRNRHQDDLFDAAVDIVIREGRGSVSLLQRALGIGYGRAARLIDYMAEDGIVGQYNGSQAREVVISLEDWQRMTGQAEEAAEPPRPARNRIVTGARGGDDEPARPARAGKKSSGAKPARSAGAKALLASPVLEEESGEDDDSPVGYFDEEETRARNSSIRLSDWAEMDEEEDEDEGDVDAAGANNELDEIDEIDGEIEGEADDAEDEVDDEREADESDEDDVESSTAEETDDEAEDAFAEADQEETDERDVAPWEEKPRPSPGPQRRRA